MSFPFLQPYFGLGNSLQTAQSGGAGGGVVGGWVEVGRTTLGSSGQTINVSSIPDNQYLMVLHNYKLTGASTGGFLRCGNSTIDTGSNYARRKSVNGGAEATAGSTTTLMDVGGSDATKELAISYFENKAASEKLHMNLYSYGLDGKTNAPKRATTVSKWANTSNVIDTLEATQGGSDNFSSGDEMVVLGWDPSSTHSTNFWEELESLDISSTGDDFDSTTFETKKYLWVQYSVSGTSSLRTRLFLGTGGTIDTGSNYAFRRSKNHEADSTFTAGGYGIVNADGSPNSTQEYVNCFIVNDSAHEKMSVWQEIRDNTAGAGNVPGTSEGVGKWANTSGQINIVSLRNDGGGDITSGHLRVWGSD